MIKISVFNKINDKSIVDTFKNVLQRRSSELFQPTSWSSGQSKIYVSIASHFVHVGWSPPESK